MRKFTTILCCLAFGLFGVGLAISGLDPPNLSHAQSAAAMTPSIYQYDTSYPTTTIIDSSSLPLDLQLDQAKKALTDADITTANVDSAIVDSLEQVITELKQKKQVTKVKWRTGPAPPPIVQKDTIRVPVYYLATQVGTKEEPTGNCISVYEVHQVDEICPEQQTSTVIDR